MTTGTPPIEYQAAAALGEVLRNLPSAADMEEAGLLPVLYQDHVANTVMFTVNGIVFHAVVVAAA